MTVEFVENLFYVKKTPLEYKVDALGDAFERLVEVVLKIPDSFDVKILKIMETIGNLEDKLNSIENAMLGLKTKKTPSNATPKPPPPSPSDLKKNVQPVQGNPRRDIVRELNEIFKERKKLNK